MSSIKCIAHRIQKQGGRTPGDDLRNMKDSLVLLGEIEEGLSTAIYVLSKIRNVDASGGSAGWSKMLGALSGMAPILFDSTDLIKKRVTEAEKGGE